MAKNSATGQEAGAVYVSVMPSGQGFSRAMDRDLSGAFTGAATRGTATFGQMFRRVAAIGATVLAAVGLKNLVKDTIALGVSYNTLEQSSRAAFTTLLGTAEAAADMQKQVREFAMTSPFPRQAFIRGTQQLLAFGFQAEQIIPTLDAVQDAVAAAGGGSQQLEEIIFVMAQIRAAGKITGIDLIQFGQRGINAAELIGSQMGKTGAQIKAAITSGALGADEALDALTKGMKAKFGGAAENVKKTWVGATDRIRGAYRDLSSALIAPFVDPKGGGAAVGWANTFADLLRTIEKSPGLKAMQDGLTQLGDKLTPLITKGADLISLLFEEDGPRKFADAVKGIADQFPGLQVVLSILDALKPILPAIAEILPALAPELEKLAPKFTDMVEALVPLIPPLAELVVALAPSLIQLIPPLTNSLIKLLEATTGNQPVFQALADILGFVFGLVDSNMHVFAGFFSMIGDGKVTISELVDWVYRIPGPMGDLVRGFANLAIGVMNVAVDAINGIADAIEAVVNGISNALGLGNVLNFPRLSHVPDVAQILSMFGAAKGGGPGGRTGRFGPVAMAAGGTILPRPGGTLILAAEAGRAESVVDTGKLNDLIGGATGRSGDGFRDLILQNPDPHVLLELFTQRFGQKVRLV